MTSHIDMYHIMAACDGAAQKQPRHPRPTEKPPNSVPLEKPAQDPPRHLPPDTMPPKRPKIK